MMKRIFPYIAFTCLTAIAASSNFSVIAGSCSIHKNKRVEVKCDKNDTKCQSEKSEKFDFKETIKS